MVDASQPVTTQVDPDASGTIDWDRPVKFLWLIGLIDRGVQRSLQRELKPHGLSLPEYSTLAVLHWSPGLSNAELARRSLVTPQSMIEVVARLEQRGLVERQRHPEHGRILMTTVTDAGRELLQGALASLAAFEADLLIDIPTAELETVKGQLRSILDRLQQLQ
ncbi:MAG: MarR family winged helix-turn-helix transcriptional regulator [Acidimicrobiales bacterium]